MRRKSVNELAIRNLSNQDIYVQAGDIVRGGEQDRMISTDFIVPPRSGRMPIAAFCVESGRWRKRGSEEAASFSSSENSVALKEIKLAAKSSNSQQAVWENVKVAQEKLSSNVSASVLDASSPTSLELSVENPKVKETTAAYIDALSGILQNKTDVIGYVFAINGQVNSADIYASRAIVCETLAQTHQGKRGRSGRRVEKRSRDETSYRRDRQNISYGIRTGVLLRRRMLRRALGSLPEKTTRMRSSKRRTARKRMALFIEITFASSDALERTGERLFQTVARHPFMRHAMARWGEGFSRGVG